MFHADADRRIKKWPVRNKMPAVRGLVWPVRSIGIIHGKAARLFMWRTRRASPSLRYSAGWPPIPNGFMLAAD
jgi:hypothetical protein